MIKGFRGLYSFLITKLFISIGAIEGWVGMCKKLEILQSEVNDLIGDIDFLEQITSEWIAKGFDHIPNEEYNVKDLSKLEVWLNVKTELNTNFIYLYNKAQKIFPTKIKLGEIEEYFICVNDPRLVPYPKSISIILNKIQFFKRKVLLAVSRGEFETKIVHNNASKSKTDNLKIPRVKTFPEWHSDITFNRKRLKIPPRSNEIDFLKIFFDHPHDSYSIQDLRKLFNGESHPYISQGKLYNMTSEFEACLAIDEITNKEKNKHWQLRKET